jgi:ATP-binding cassette, subfamily F, member 3
MAVLLQASGLGFQFGERALLAGADLVVNEGDRIGLVGHNGAGKTTLLDLLAGSRQPDQGEIRRRRGLNVARVEQFLPAAAARGTVLDAALVRVSTGERWRAEQMLAQFGFGAGDHALPVRALSGGQLNRLMFARALLSEPQLLLLDEPTNHLDLATLVVFERVLASWRGAFVLVSHDREFLDAVTGRTVFLRDGRLWSFAQPYSIARSALDDSDRASAEARRAEDRRIEALRKSARRLAEWGRVYDNEKFARRAKSMEKHIVRLESARTFVTAGSPLDLTLTLGDVRSRQVLAIDRHEVAVPGRSLFGIRELVIRPGDRVALLGHNGTGKTTLIRQLTAPAETRPAAIRLSPQVRLGYYDQELEEASGDEPLRVFVARRTDCADPVVRQHLIRAGFAYAEHGKPVSALSGGERARLLFLVLAIRAPNFLVLDEPTNHIDIEGKEQLEAQLLDGGATLLFTSHDRRFLETLATRYLWIADGRLQELPDPDPFYRSGPSPRTEGAGEASRERSTPRSLDALLERMIELEALLAADLARKPKHQKPALQRAWRAELAGLERELEARGERREPGAPDAP